MTKTNPAIVMYGADWCPDCRRSKAVLERSQVAYTYIIVDGNEEASDFVRSKNNGRRTIPTIIFPDGSHLTEPSDPDLEQKLKTLGFLA